MLSASPQTFMLLVGISNGMQGQCITVAAHSESAPITLQHVLCTMLPPTPLQYRPNSCAQQAPWLLGVMKKVQP